MELPVETYWGRQEGQRKRSAPQEFPCQGLHLVRTVQDFQAVCFNCEFLRLEIKLHKMYNDMICCFAGKTVKVNINKTNQPKHSLWSRWPTIQKEPFFPFLLPWVTEGHKLCHVVYMLTQKEGQVLAIRSLGLMWPGHGLGSSESPFESQWHVVSIHLQSETFYANWQSVALAYPPPRGNSSDWCLLDMH